MVLVDLKSPSPSDRIATKACKRCTTVPIPTTLLDIIKIQANSSILGLNHNLCK